MRDVFFSHFASDEDRRALIWKECFFVFDTNVLTAVYKRSDQARDAMYEIIRSLGDRLWIPHQVGYEFLDNRAKITHDQSRLYADASSTLQVFLESLEVATRHPFLSEKLHNEFVDICCKVIAELDEKKDFHDARLTTDDVKQELAKLLAGKVGRKYEDERLKMVLKEGEVRYSNQIPPGFQDVNKHKGSTVFGDVCKRYGDLIIWKQVIDKAKELNRPVILVTGEQKDDWWDKCGGKIIGPLPKLIEEFNSEVGKDFYLYSYHSFLNLANDYLHQSTSAEVIEEVREAEIDEALSIDDFESYPQQYLDASRSSFVLSDSSVAIQLSQLQQLLNAAKKDKVRAELGLALYSDRRSSEARSKIAIYRSRKAAAELRIRELSKRILELESVVLHSEKVGVDDL